MTTCWTLPNLHLCHLPELYFLLSPLHKFVHGVRRAVTDEVIKHQSCMGGSQFSDHHLLAQMSSSSESFRFHGLPEDLARLVIEILADVSPNTAFTCALVSKKVNAWSVLGTILALVD